MTTKDLEIGSNGPYHKATSNQKSRRKPSNSGLVLRNSALQSEHRKQTAEQVWADCWQGAWKLHKLPQEIITDQGTVFTTE